MSTQRRGASSPDSRPSRRPSPSSTLSYSTPKSLSTLAVVGLVVLACLSPVVKAALYEPPGNQVLFGAWLDTDIGYRDSPAALNQRLGYNVPVFQIAQVIPLPPYNSSTGAGGAAPENLIELSETDAAVFLTVYPNLGFDAVTDTDVAQLAGQIQDYHDNLNRTVFLRYAPEMQGTWNAYGMQPTGFIASYRRIYAAVKAVAPGTIMVWAPNTPQGYPYGENFAEMGTLQVDITALDTNNNTILDSGDDSLLPYWPGDDVVDWSGLSLYYKGMDSDILNEDQPRGYCAAAINGTSPNDGAVISNWYHRFCTLKPDVACMYAESGAAFHVNDGGGATQLTLQKAWIDDCITNAAFLDEFPRLKLLMAFEYEKYEMSNTGTQDLRDFRMTNNTGVLAELRAGILPIADRFSWAQSRSPPTSVSSPGAPPATNSAGSTDQFAITATTRPRPTTFPSLFGTTSSAALRAEIIELGVLVASGIAGAVVLMKMV